MTEGICNRRRFLQAGVGAVASLWACRIGYAAAERRKPNFVLILDLGGDIGVLGNTGERPPIWTRLAAKALFTIPQQRTGL